MKRFIYLVLCLSLFVSVQAEDFVWQTFYNDGLQNLFPDSCSIQLYYAGAIVDSVTIDSTANWSETKRFLVCTLTTTNTGRHWVYEYMVEGSDTVSGFIEWNNADTANRNVSILVASDNIGVNLDDVSGTLDAAEIGSNAITAAKIGSNAITAAKIADDAIDYGTFAATAPTAWWNQGKTGYSADMVSVSGDATAANNLEAMLDGTGGVTLDLKKIAIRNTTVGDTGVIVTSAAGSDTGIAIFLEGDKHAVELKSLDGTALYGWAGDTAVWWYGITAGLYIDGGSGYDIEANIQGTLDSVDKAPSATISASDMADIADSVWVVPWDYAFTAGSMGDSLSTAAYVQGTAAGLDSAAVYGAVKQFLSYDSNNVVYLSQVVIAGGTADSAALHIANTTSGGTAARFAGNGAGHGITATTSTGSGIYAYAGGVGGFGGRFSVGNDSAIGLAIYGPASTKKGGYGLKVETMGTGDAIQVCAGDSGIGLEVEGSLYDAGVFLHGAASGNSGTRHGVFIKAYDSASYALYMQSDSGNKVVRISAPTALDTALYLAGRMVVAGDMYTDIHGTIDTATYVDTVGSNITASASLGGAGAYTATIYAVDSSGTDAAVSGVYLNVYNMSGTRIALLPTNTSGYRTFALDSGSYDIRSSIRNGYIWNRDTITVTTDQTDTLWGYNITIGAPSGDSLCRVYGYVYGADGNAVEDATVTWQISGRNIYDICNSTIQIKSEGSTQSDSTGLFTLDLLYSTCLQRSATGTDSIAYLISIDYPNGLSVTKRPFYVPAADSVAFTW